MWIRRKSRIIPDIPNCLNCGYSFVGDDNFCANCGQTRTDGRVTVLDLMKDAFRDILNIDSRIFLSLRDLFRPGKLTKNFFAGKHQTYYPPARFFFVSMVIHFAILGFLINHHLKNRNLDLTQSHIVREALGKKALLDTIIHDLDSIGTDAGYLSELDSLRLHFEDASNDSIDVSFMDIEGVELQMGSSISIAKSDLDGLTRKDLKDKYKVENGISQYMIFQTVSVMQKPKLAFRFFISNLVWMVLALVHILALFMKLLYLRHSIFFVEHMVFLFHIHVFTFLILSLTYLLSFVIPINLTLMPLLAGIIYTYFSLKIFYGQGAWKTFIKFVLLGFAYMFVALILLIFTTLLSMAFFN